jgi:1-acyl-sn-glycerol-3-phosphate acyltransferase
MQRVVHMLDTGSGGPVLRLLRAALWLLMRLAFRIEVHGAGRIPPSGPLVIIANHVTYFDPVWIGVRCYRTLRYMAWDRLFVFPPAGALLRWCGAFPVSLDNPEGNAYRTALGILAGGGALLMFPEGGRSPDGTLMRFKPGAANLAIRTGATLLPVAIHGGVRVWNRRMVLPRPEKITLEYLQPIEGGHSNVTAQELTARARILIERALSAADEKASAQRRRRGKERSRAASAGGRG